MLGIVAEGNSTQTVGGGEVTLGNVTDVTNGIFILQADLNLMASGDTIEFRAYIIVRGGGTERLAVVPAASNGVVSFTNAQTPPIKPNVFGYVEAPISFRCSIKQTAGTARAIPFAIYKG